MRRPSFQFYPGDWSSNPNLRRCTFAERGIWVDVMCLMHDQDEYGVLRWPLKEIAGAVGCKVSELQSLVRKGVMKGNDSRLDEPFVYVPRSGRKDGEPVILIDTQAGPIWYSSRMVKDEYVRLTRGGETRFDGSQSSDKKLNQPAKKAKTQDGTERSKLRFKVLEKTGGKCYHCNSELPDAWEIDHLVPRARGGRHTFANMVPSCVRCNQDKSDTMPDDWAALKFAPNHAVGDRSGPRDSSSSSSSSSKTKGDQAASTDLDPAAAPPPHDPIQSRALELVAMLRQRGASIAAGNPHARRWAETGVTDAQALRALETAERRRSETGSPQPVNAGLLNAIIEDHQRAPPQRKNIHDERAATIAALTGRSRNHEHESGNVIDITPTAVAG